MDIKAAVIASAFSAFIDEALTPSELEAVNALNVGNYGTPVCATGNFLDSNMLMAEAFGQAMGREVDMQSEKDVNLWNAAWEIAKDHNFDWVLINAIAETLV